MIPTYPPVITRDRNKSKICSTERHKLTLTRRGKDGGFCSRAFYHDSSFPRTRNPGWFSAQLAWIPAFADMTEAAVTNVFRVLHSTIGHPHCILIGESLAHTHPFLR